MGDWVKDMFARRKASEEAARLVNQERGIDQAFLREQLPVFWNTLVETMKRRITTFNENIERENMKLHVEPREDYRFQARRAYYPLAEISVSLNPEAFTIFCSAKVDSQEWVETYQLRVSDRSIYVTDDMQRHVQELDRNILGTFLRRMFENQD